MQVSPPGHWLAKGGSEGHQVCDPPLTWNGGAIPAPGRVWGSVGRIWGRPGPAPGGAGRGMPARNPARGCRTHLVRPVDVAIRAAHQLRPVKRYMPVRLRVRQAAHRGLPGDTDSPAPPGPGRQVFRGQIWAGETRHRGPAFLRVVFPSRCKARQARASGMSGLWVPRSGGWGGAHSGPQGHRAEAERWACQ